MKHEQEHESYRQAIICMKPDFFETVRRRAKQASTDKAYSTTWPRWIIPALGAACAAAIVCTGIPSVRASLVNVFRNDSGHSAADYVNTAAYERPEVENVHVAQMESTKWCLRRFADSDFTWGDGIRDVRLLESLYDSGAEELTLKYVIDGSAAGIYFGEQINEEVASTDHYSEGRTYPCVDPGLLVEDASSLVAIEDVSEAEYVAPQSSLHTGVRTVSVNDSGRITITTTYPLPRSAADSELILMIPCSNVVLSENNTRADFTHLGYLQIPFRINSEDSIGKTAPSGTYMVNSKPVEITEAVLSPTGLRIRFNVTEGLFPWDLDFDVYADGQLLTDSIDSRASYLDYLMGDSQSDALEGLIRVPFADTNTSTISLVPVSRSTGVPVGNETLDLNFE